jgi:hypothetical protein
MRAMKPLGLLALVLAGSLACSEEPPAAAPPIRLEYYSIGET